MGRASPPCLLGTPQAAKTSLDVLGAFTHVRVTRQHRDEMARAARFREALHRASTGTVWLCRVLSVPPAHPRGVQEPAALTEVRRPDGPAVGTMSIPEYRKGAFSSLARTAQFRRRGGDRGGFGGQAAESSTLPPGWDRFYASCRRLGL
jgi:hypothetical protein